MVQEDGVVRSAAEAVVDDVVGARRRHVAPRSAASRATRRGQHRDAGRRIANRAAASAITRISDGRLRRRSASPTRRCRRSGRRPHDPAATPRAALPIRLRRSGANSSASQLANSSDRFGRHLRGASAPSTRPAPAAQPSPRWIDAAEDPGVAVIADDDDSSGASLPRKMPVTVQTGRTRRRCGLSSERAPGPVRRVERIATQPHASGAAGPPSARRISRASSRRAGR